MDPAFDSHDLTMTTHFYFVALVFTLGTLTSYFLTRMSDLHEDTIWSSSDLRPFCAISMFLFTVIFDLVSTLVLLFVSHLDAVTLCMVYMTCFLVSMVCTMNCPMFIIASIQQHMKYLGVLPVTEETKLALPEYKAFAQFFSGTSTKW